MLSLIPAAPPGDGDWGHNRRLCCNPTPDTPTNHNWRILPMSPRPKGRPITKGRHLGVRPLLCGHIHAPVQYLAPPLSLVWSPALQVCLRAWLWEGSKGLWEVFVRWNSSVIYYLTILAMAIYVDRFLRIAYWLGERILFVSQKP